MHSFFLANEYMDVDYFHEKYNLSAMEVKRIAKIMPSSGQGIKVENFFDKPLWEQKKALDMFRKDQTYSVEDYEAWKNECVQELCKCVYIKGNLADLMFVSALPNGDLELTYMYGKEPKGMAALLHDVLTEKERLYPDAGVTFEALSPEAEQLAEHMFPGVETIHMHEAEF